MQDYTTGCPQSSWPELNPAQARHHNLDRIIGCALRIAAAGPGCNFVDSSWELGWPRRREARYAAPASAVADAGHWLAVDTNIHGRALLGQPAHSCRRGRIAPQQRGCWWQTNYGGNSETTKQLPHSAYCTTAQLAAVGQPNPGATVARPSHACSSTARRFELVGQLAQPIAGRWRRRT